MSYLRKCSEKRRNRHGCHLVTSIAENLAYSLLFKRLSPEDHFIKYDCDAAEIKRMQQPKKQVEVITKDTIKRIFASINTRT